MTAHETRVYSVRIPDGLIEEIQSDLVSDSDHGADPATTLTTWLLRAIRERLAHRRRSRNKRRPRTPRDADGWPLVRVGLADGASEEA